MMEQNDLDTPWYSKAGPYDDVIISSRVRITRNLSDFVFTHKLSEEDRDRIKFLVSDSMDKLTGDERKLELVDVKAISQQGKLILTERNILSEEKCDYIFMNDNGNDFCRVNETDHLKICSYKAGMDFERAMEDIYFYDEIFQKNLQFAASFDFGYLSAKICDTGTGLKFSFWCYIPALVFSNNLDSIVSLVMEHNLSIKPVLKTEKQSDFPSALFEISTIMCQKGNEFDQMAEIQSIATIILNSERKIRAKLADNNNTIILNFVKQAYAKSLSSMLLLYSESLSVISAVKFGLHCGFVTGILDSDLNSLIYKLKDAHLQYLNQSYDFSFEEDIKKNQTLQVQRLRAVVIQETIQKLKFN